METINLLSNKAFDKVKRLYASPHSQAIRAFMAGVYISLGAIFMVIVKNDSTLSPAISSLLSGLVFSLGLIFVIVCEGELFTGNCLMLIGVFRKKINIRQFTILLSHTLLWNCFGCFMTSGLLILSGFDIDIFRQMMTTKIMENSIISSFGKAIFCNVLVCLAVYTSAGTFRRNQSISVIVFPVSMFVACGFEHSIADIFMGMFFNFSIAPFEALIFFSVVIFGNIIGGFLLSWLLNSSYESIS